MRISIQLGDPESRRGRSPPATLLPQPRCRLTSAELCGLYDWQGLAASGSSVRCPWYFPGLLQVRRAQLLHAAGCARGWVAAVLVVLLRWGASAMLRALQGPPSLQLGACVFCIPVQHAALAHLVVGVAERRPLLVATARKLFATVHKASGVGNRGRRGCLLR